MEKNPDEIPMFTRFAERGLSLPASDFFKGLLGYYGLGGTRSQQCKRVSSYLSYWRRSRH
jgi:hypothetical protein